MGKEQLFVVALMLGLLGIAVVSDLRRHRIPNLLVLVGLGLGIAGQVYSSGVIGFGYGLLGMLIGFAVFFPCTPLAGWQPATSSSWPWLALFSLRSTPSGLHFSA